MQIPCENRERSIKLGRLWDEPDGWELQGALNGLHQASALGREASGPGAERRRADRECPVSPGRVMREGHARWALLPGRAWVLGQSFEPGPRFYRPR